MKKSGLFEKERAFEKREGKIKGVRIIYSTDQCGYRDTFGLYIYIYILQIDGDTETRSGYISHVVVYYVTPNELINPSDLTRDRNTNTLTLTLP